MYIYIYICYIYTYLYENLRSLVQSTRGFLGLSSASKTRKNAVISKLSGHFGGFLGLSSSKTLRRRAFSLAGSLENTESAVFSKPSKQKTCKNTVFSSWALEHVRFHLPGASETQKNAAFSFTVTVRHRSSKSLFEIAVRSHCSR